MKYSEPLIPTIRHTEAKEEIYFSPIKINRIWVEFDRQHVSSFLKMDIDKLLSRYTGSSPTEDVLRSTRFFVQNFIETAQENGILWLDETRRWRYIL